MFQNYGLNEEFEKNIVGLFAVGAAVMGETNKGGVWAKIKNNDISLLA